MLMLVFDMIVLCDGVCLFQNDAGGIKSRSSGFKLKIILIEFDFKIFFQLNHFISDIF